VKGDAAHLDGVVTTIDGLDFGERFVPGYQAPSLVDALLESPFEE
jgi:hypothetical protein